MSVHLITGYAGNGHVTSADAGRFNAGLCGMDRYVLNTGTQFAYIVESSNLIKIGSGDAVDQGRHINIPENSFENVSLQNGSQNRSRIDVIALRYKKDVETGIESAGLVVVKGMEVAAGSVPDVPETLNGNIFNGAIEDDLPLYHVHINNTQIVQVKAVFQKIPSLSAITDLIYPIGSVYISVNGTNPEVMFGGKWEEIQGRFLLSRSADINAGATGGAKTIKLKEENLPAHTHTVPKHTHSATVGSAGAHTHKVNRAKLGATGTARYVLQDNSKEPDANYKNTQSAGAHTHKITVKEAASANTGKTGKGTAVNVMPPYLAVYMWQRTA